MINGTQVTSIDFEGTTYWSVPVDSTNIFKSTTMTYGTNMDRYYPTVGDSIVNNSITYYAVDFPAPFQNTTVTGNHTEQTPNYQEDIPYFGSFDFTQKSFGFTLASAEYIPGSTTSITQTNSITSTEENSPGFTAVVSMITVGAIAYVAPRMRKKEN
jgi:signal peptidase I